MSLWKGFLLLGCVLQVFGDPLIGGRHAPPATYPYQVSLQNNKHHFCGGSIISTKWVLTAAHCVHKKVANEVTVFAGSIYLYKKGDRYTVELVKIHEDYNDVTTVNDIAVLAVHNSMVFSKNVQSIRLGNSVPASGIIAIVTGWGYINVFQSVLRNNCMK